MKFNVKLNAKRNMVFGIINKVVLMVLPLVVKAMINVYLGAEYLGLNSLFSSILQVLLLTEMGFSSALVYHMYKPIADNDQDTINALLNLYRSAYRMIGFVVLILGMAIIPLLPYWIKGSYPTDVNIIVIYIIQLVNTAISYFLFGYKQSLLVAYQREDINSIINLVVQAGLQILQILLLVFTTNYYFYVICMPFATIINNLWIGYITRKIFPDAKCAGHLDKSVLSDIKRLVAGTFIQKACATTRNSLDSIFISAFLGLTLTGIYNNYYLIMNGVIALTAIITTSLSGGIGNHVAVKSIDENFQELKQLDFLYMTISGICVCLMLCLYQPFMELWMGKDMLLPVPIVILFCLYFYILKTGDIKTLYSSANGMWWKMRFRSISETACNCVLNFVLGKFLGIYGIIIATTISLFFCNFLWASEIIFKNYFGIKKFKYFLGYHFVYAIKTAAACSICYLISTRIRIENMHLRIIDITIVTVVFSASFYYLTSFKSKIFKNAIRMVRR